MKIGKITLLVVASAITALMVTACTKTASSANANVDSSAAKNNSSSSGASSAASKRFVGLWTEEGEKNDKGTRFTEDGKIIEVSGEKQVGTYTTAGNDKANITIAEGGTGTATPESDARMLVEIGKEKTYLVKK